MLERAGADVKRDFSRPVVCPEAHHPSERLIAASPIEKGELRPVWHEINHGRLLRGQSVWLSVGLADEMIWHPRWMPRSRSRMRQRATSRMPTDMVGEVPKRGAQLPFLFKGGN